MIISNNKLENKTITILTRYYKTLLRKYLYYVAEFFPNYITLVITYTYTNIKVL